MTFDIDIDSYIGCPISYDWVKSRLSGLEGRPVAVRIASLGGDVADALAIMSLFQNHGDVTAYVQGMTASAATIIAAGCRRVVMDRHALLLVHNCSGPVYEWDFMNADEIAGAIERLTAQKNDQETIDRVFSSIYAERAIGKKTREELAALMSENKWIDAPTALAFGLVDEIRTPEKEEEEADLRAFIEKEGSHLAALALPLPLDEQTAATAGEKKAAKDGTRPACNSERRRPSIIDRIKEVFKDKEEEPRKQPSDIEAESTCASCLPDLDTDALHPETTQELNPETVNTMDEEEKKYPSQEDFADLKKAVEDLSEKVTALETRLAALETDEMEKPALPEAPDVEDSYGLQQTAYVEEQPLKAETPRDRLARIASIL